MQLNISHIFLWLYWFSTVSPTNDNPLSAFTKRTLQLCQQLSMGEIREDERIANDVIKTLKKYPKCIQRLWIKCTRKQNLSVTVAKYSISDKPCFASSLHLPDHNFSFNIQVYQIFQINLTFTSFNLKRSGSGCKFHNIKVNHSWVRR